MPKKKITDGMRQRSNGSWEMTEIIGGKRRWFSAKLPEDVLKKRDEALQEEERQKEQLKMGPFFEEVADAYQERLYTMKNGTQKAYQPALERAREWFKGKRMREIDPYMIAQFLQSIPSKAHTTVSNHKTVVNSIFQLWIDDPVWRGDFNPAELTKMPRGLKRGKRKPPTDEQIQVVRDHYLDPDALPAVCYLCTGGRKGEVNALQLKDIDFENGVIHITKSVEHINNKPHIHGTKTEAGVRTIPLLQMMREALEPLRNLPPETFLLSGTDKPLTASAYNRRWESFWRKYGMAHPIVRMKKRTKPNGEVEAIHYTDWKADVCAHQFRHEYVCMLCMAGISEEVAIQLVGHTNVKMIHDVYFSIKPQMIKDAKNRLNLYLDR